MNWNKVIENRVAKSGIITLDLVDFIPSGNQYVVDMKDFMQDGLILREKDFRLRIKEKDWSEFQDSFVAVSNSSDGIIPLWAYMLISSALQPYSSLVVRGNKSHLKGALLKRSIEAIDESEYKDKRVIIKGCGKESIPESAYIAITQKLQPVVRSLMFGEACSTVPVFKA
ncbi:MAG: hypothetical protein CMD20_02545 [Flavobacteriales bacterium]|nr:hypothetical protein [Flavobacteriales bacterium]